VFDYAITQSGLHVCWLKNSLPVLKWPPNYVWYQPLNILAQRWHRKGLEVWYVLCSVRVFSSEMAWRLHRDISEGYYGRDLVMFSLGVGIGMMEWFYLLWPKVTGNLVLRASVPNFLHSCDQILNLWLIAHILTHLDLRWNLSHLIYYEISKLIENWWCFPSSDCLDSISG
jgi:hypothetical protein